LFARWTELNWDICRSSSSTLTENSCVCVILYLCNTLNPDHKSRECKTLKMYNGTCNDRDTEKYILSAFFCRSKGCIHILQIMSHPLCYPQLPHTVITPSVCWHMHSASEPSYFLVQQYCHCRHGPTALVHTYLQLSPPGISITLSPKACQD
jgi:hypothetical protein